MGKEISIRKGNKEFITGRAHPKYRNQLAIIKAVGWSIY